MGNNRKRYSPEFKFRVVMEALRTDKPMAEVARAYDVHPVTLSQWKRHFEEHGAEVFGGKEEVKQVPPPRTPPYTPLIPSLAACQHPSASH